MTLTDLIKSAEEKLANPDLTIGTRRREEAILHHLTNLERAVTELESQNTELYVDLCEMARERSRKRDAVIGVDLAGGVDYTVDPLIRPKWPEEKPDRNGRYLAFIEREYNNFMTILEWHNGEWFRYTYEKEMFVREDEVTHWWNLPEVKE